MSIKFKTVQNWAQWTDTVRTLCVSATVMTQVQSSGTWKSFEWLTISSGTSDRLKVPSNPVTWNRQEPWSGILGAINVRHTTLIELSSNLKKIKSSFDDEQPPPPVPIGRDLTRVGQELIHGPETGVLDVIVRSEAKPQVSLRRRDDGGESPAAISSHQCRIAVSPVTDLQKVVQAMFMRLDIEHVTEIDTNHEARLGCKCETNQILNLPLFSLAKK